MQRPKWLSGWGEGKNILEACLLIDIPDIRVVEASFGRKLLFFAVGAFKKRDTADSLFPDEKNYEEKSIQDLEWRVFYDSTALTKLMPMDKAKDLMNGIISASAGSSSIYKPNTIYIASGDRPAKGNAPLLLDYEMAKKIDEAKKNNKAS